LLNGKDRAKGVGHATLSDFHHLAIDVYAPDSLFGTMRNMREKLLRFLDDPDWNFIQPILHCNAVCQLPAIANQHFDQFIFLKPRLIGKRCAIHEVFQS